MKFSPNSRRQAFDFGLSCASIEAGSRRHYRLTNTEKKWLFNIQVGTMVYRRHLFVDIQPYVLSRYALQLGLSQGIVEAPTSMAKRYGSL